MTEKLFTQAFGKKFQEEEPARARALFDHIDKYGSVKRSEIEFLHNYMGRLTGAIEQEKWILRHHPNFPREIFDEIKEELSYCSRTIYKNQYNSIANIFFKFDQIKGTDYNGYSQDTFYMFLDYVKLINSYYDIAEPNKPANKIAWGWNKAWQKNKSKPYLFACIRNYLQANKVSFKVSEIQKICGLKDIQDGDY